MLVYQEKTVVSEDRDNFLIEYLCEMETEFENTLACFFCLIPYQYFGCYPDS